MKWLLKIAAVTVSVWLALVLVHEYGARKYLEGMRAFVDLDGLIKKEQTVIDIQERQQTHRKRWNMIFSKANLQSAEITRADKGIPALDNLHMRKDGTTIAANGSCVVACSPVKDTDAAKVPLVRTEMIQDETVSTETIREVLKGMPKDSLFSGALEHCDFAKGKFTLTDGKRHRTVSARTYPREYIKYQDIYKRVLMGHTSHRVAVNLRRLVDCLAVIDKMFPDSSKNTAVYVEFTDSNDVVLRVIDVRAKQKTIAVLRSYTGAEANWPQVDEWEKTLASDPRSHAETRADIEKKVHKIQKTRRVRPQ